MARILIAEDDAHMLRILSIWLKRNGHETFEARNGLLAKEELLRREYDLIVSDVNMPLLDGLSLARWLRLEHKRSLPMIILSSRCDRESMAEQLDALNVLVMPKPFSPSRLAAEVERMLTNAPPASRCPPVPARQTGTHAVARTTELPTPAVDSHSGESRNPARNFRHSGESRNPEPQPCLPDSTLTTQGKLRDG